MKNKKLLHILNWLTSISLLVGVVLFSYNNSSIAFDKIEISYFYLFFLILVSLIHSFFTSYFQRNILITQSVILDHKKNFALTAVADLYNFLLPAKSGSLIRMIFLKENFGLSKRKFLSMGLASAMIGLSSLGLMGFIYTQIFFTKKDLIFLALESLFLALMISSFVLVFSSELTAKIFKLKKTNTLQIYFRDLKFVNNSISMYIVSALVVPLRLFIVFSAVGVSLSPMEVLDISLILIVISWVQILPGNLGLKELALTYLAQKFGISYELSLVASLLDRGVGLIYLIVIGKLSYWNLLNNKQIYLVNVTLDKLFGASGFFPKAIAKESTIK